MLKSKKAGQYDREDFGPVLGAIMALMCAINNMLADGLHGYIRHLRGRTATNDAIKALFEAPVLRFSTSQEILPSVQEGARMNVKFDISQVDMSSLVIYDPFNLINKPNDVWEAFKKIGGLAALHGQPVLTKKLDNTGLDVKLEINVSGLTTYISNRLPATAPQDGEYIYTFAEGQGEYGEISFRMANQPYMTARIMKLDWLIGQLGLKAPISSKAKAKIAVNARAKMAMPTPPVQEPQPNLTDEIPDEVLAQE